MHDASSTPIWTTPRLVELARADEAEAGANYWIIEDLLYTASLPG